MTDVNNPKANYRDIWNAFMAKDATFSNNDIPFCPTTAREIPGTLISYTKAKTIYDRQIKRGDKNFFIDVFVHFYKHDYKFDGKIGGIWVAPHKAAEILSHFAGIITPDVSTYADFPFPLKNYNTYRRRTFGYWYGKLGHAVINNVRWGTAETFAYCFDRIPTNSIVAIGTVASGLRSTNNRQNFEVRFRKMFDVLKPHTTIIYGSANYSLFANIKQEIQIVNFPSETALVFEDR